ncbi:MFS transporter [Bradyrhizobium sp. INPA03-11B]|uniref:MFS transporter n=1 Tax=Bradyrhizobium sp. INPA03-11B TaxID=418598 RepID=UPI00338FF63F
MLSLLFLAYMLGFADRVIFGLVMKPIKAAYLLTDSELGLLAGIAFAASYAVFSPVGAFIVDRLPRRLVLPSAVAFWSVATAGTALAPSFWWLFVARAGVGVGEALLHPLAVSLLSDTYGPERRARAFGVYLGAGALGIMLINLLGGGLLAHIGREPISFPFGSLEPWQTLFLAAGVLGLALALLSLVMLRDLGDGDGHKTLVHAHDGGVAAYIASHPAVSAAILIGVPFLTMGGYTLNLWVIPFFERVHGWAAGTAGLSIALTCNAAAVVGCLLVGRFASGFRERVGTNAPFLLAAFGGVVFVACSSTALLVPSETASLGMLMVAFFWTFFTPVCGYTAIAEVVPRQLRARITGLLTLATGLITNSLGPYLAGVLTDRLFPATDGLRYSIAVTVIGSGLIGIVLLLSGLRGYGRVVRLQQAHEDAAPLQSAG